MTAKELILKLIESCSSGYPPEWVKELIKTETFMDCGFRNVVVEVDGVTDINIVDVYLDGCNNVCIEIKPTESEKREIYLA
jgi:hypothetical protein